MSYGEDETKRVDNYPQQIDNVVPVGSLNERAGRVKWSRFDVVGQSARNERRAQIDGDGREPNHGDAKEDAVRGIQQPCSDIGTETSVCRILPL